MLVDEKITGFLDRVESQDPTPGGGSVAALAGANAASLLLMVCGLTIGKEKFAGVEADMKSARDALLPLKKKLVELIDEDTEAFNAVMTAFKLPKESDDDKTIRKEAIQSAFKGAADTPLETAECCCHLLELGSTVADKGNPNAISDAGVAALMASAGLQGALYNVRINLPSIKDEAYVDAARKKAENLFRKGEKEKQLIMELVQKQV